jgi:hypothetical protein
VHSKVLIARCIEISEQMQKIEEQIAATPAMIDIVKIGPGS